MDNKKDTQNDTQKEIIAVETLTVIAFALLFVFIYVLSIVK